MHEQQSMLNEIDILTSGVAQKGVLAVIAHPDDGAHVYAGTLSKLRERLPDVPIGVLLITDGDFEGIRDGKRRVGEQLGENKVLGVDKFARAGLPDGRFTQGLVPYAADWIVQQVLSAEAEGIGYGTVLTFGEEGFTGHKDHESAYWAVCKAVEDLESGGVFTGNVWGARMPPDVRSMWPSDYFVPIPKRNTKGCVRIDIRGNALTAKLDALKAHPSQLNNGVARQMDVVQAHPEEYWALIRPSLQNRNLAGTVYNQNGNV